MHLTNKNDSKDKLRSIWRAPECANIIYYSFEDFTDKGNSSPPRINAIAIKNLKTNQTKSFINNNHGESEKEMLKNFFDLVKEQKDYKWIYWNKTNENFGLNILETRYIFLNGDPYIIPEKNKFNLHSIKNSIDTKVSSSSFFKTEKEEAKLFKEENYEALQKSILLKVVVFSNICKQAYEDLQNNKLAFLGKEGRAVNSVTNWLIKHPVFTFFLLVMPLVEYIAELFKWLFSKFR